MESNLDNPLNNFSIQETMDMGAGDSQLINDLMAPETSTSNPDDIEEIVKTVDSDDVEEKEKSIKVKEISPKIKSKPQKTEEGNEEDEEEESSNPLEDFLLGGDDEEEEEEDDNSSIEKEQESDEDDDDDDDKGDDENQFTALSNDLFKLGVFTKEEDEDEDVKITSAEEFRDRFIAEKKKGAIEVVNNFIGQFGEDYQKAFDAIYVKGVNPKEYFNAFNNISNFSELDLSEEKNQESVLRQALSDQGFEDEDVETEIERLKNYGDLESVANKHHKVLIKKEAAKLQQMELQAQQQLQQKAAFKNQYIGNVQNIIQDKLKTKEFDGIPLNPKLANELQDFLLVDKYKTVSGETLTDFDKTILDLKKPENHELKVKFGLLLKILEKDPTLSTIQKSGVTKESKQLFGNLAKQVTTDKTLKKQRQQKQQPKSWFQ